MVLRVLFWVLLWPGILAMAVRPGDLDTNFVADLPSIIVTSVQVQTDGKILVGHTLGITRLLANGRADSAWAPVIASAIRDVQIDSRGNVCIFGDFTAVNGIARPGIARLKPSGEFDASFDPVYPGGLKPPSSFTVDPDDAVVVLIELSFGRWREIRYAKSGGLDAGSSRDFDASGARRGHRGVTYLTPSSGLWLANGGVTQAILATEQLRLLYDVCEQANGGLLVMGELYGSWLDDRLARLDENSAVDPGFVAPEILSTNRHLACGADGKIVLMNRLAGDSNERLIRLGSDGRVDREFKAPDFTTVRTFTMDARGDMLVVGTLAGVVTNGLVRLRGAPDPAQAPEIIESPSDLTRYEGENAQFQVLAAGNGLHFQWNKNGEALPGQTNSILYFPGVLSAAEGAYIVQVTNAFGRVESAAAQLAVQSVSTNLIGEDFTEIKKLPQRSLEYFSSFRGWDWLDEGGVLGAVFFGAPAEVPRNVAGERYALRGINYAGLGDRSYSSAFISDFSVPLTTPTVPGQIYEVTGGFSLGENGGASGIPIALALYNPSESMASAGSMVVTNLQEWQRFKQTFYAADAFRNLRVSCLSTQTRGNFVYIDSLQLVPVVSPTFALVPDQLVAAGTEVRITNRVMNAAIPWGWEFTLREPIPANVRIERESGVVTWAPPFKTNISLIRVRVGATNPALAGLVLEREFELRAAPFSVGLETPFINASGFIEVPFHLAAIPPPYDVAYGGTPVQVSFDLRFPSRDLECKSASATLIREDLLHVEGKANFSLPRGPLRAGTLEFVRRDPTRPGRFSFEPFAAFAQCGIPEPRLGASTANRLSILTEGPQQIDIIGDRPWLLGKAGAAGTLDLLSLAKPSAFWKLEFTMTPNIGSSWQMIGQFQQSGSTFNVPALFTTNAMGFFRTSSP